MIALRSIGDIGVAAVAVRPPETDAELDSSLPEIPLGAETISVLDAIPGASIQVFAFDGTLLYANSIARALFGAPQEGAKRLGLPASDDDRQLFDRGFAVCVAGRSAVGPFELRLLKRSSTVVEVRTTLFPIITYSGQSVVICAELNQMEQRLREGIEAQHHDVVNGLADGLVFWDDHLDLVWGNRAASRLLGVPIEELRTLDDFVLGLLDRGEAFWALDAQARDELLERVVSRIRNKRPTYFKERLPDGRELRLRHGALTTGGHLTVISDRPGGGDRRAKRSLENTIERMLESVATPMALIEADGRFTHVNRAFTDLTGESAGGTLTLNALLVAGNGQARADEVWTSVGRDGAWRGRLRVLRRDGFASVRHVSIVGGRRAEQDPLIISFGESAVPSALEASIEIHLQNECQSRDTVQALRCRLQGTKGAWQHDGAKGVICMAFAEGDGYLPPALASQITSRLLALSHPDAALTWVEHAAYLVVPEGDTDHLALAANRISSELLSAEESLPGFSVGVARFPHDDATLHGILGLAFGAACQAASEGNGALRFCDATDDTRAKELLWSLHAVEHAIANNEFVLVYQMQKGISSNRVIALEALLRWHPSADETLLPPSFLHVATLAGLLPAITRLVANGVCAQAADWERRGKPVRVAINTSEAEILHPDFVQTVADALSSSGVAPERIEIECPASVLEAPGAVETIAAVKALGLSIALTNFGATPIDAARLRSLRIDKVKVSRAMTRQMLFNPDAQAVFAGMMQLARCLQIRSVAEGVEVEEAMEILSANSCFAAQGNLIAPPLPPEVVFARLQAAKSVSGE